MPKHAIRSRLLEQRSRLSAERHQADSLAAQQHLLDSAEFAAAGRVGLYSPIRKEVATDRLRVAAESAGKPLVYPRVSGDCLEFVSVRPGEELVKGSFGVAEPAGSELVALADIDLLVLPGVAFDRRGHRLGYGKGYYDRALESLNDRPVVVGLAFGFQQVKTLPSQEHDVQLMMLVTESGFARFAGVDRERG